MERKSSTEYSVVFLGKQKVQVTFKDFIFVAGSVLRTGSAQRLSSQYFAVVPISNIGELVHSGFFCPQQWFLRRHFRFSFRRSGRLVGLTLRGSRFLFFSHCFLLSRFFVGNYFKALLNLYIISVIGYNFITPCKLLISRLYSNTLYLNLKSPYTFGMSLLIPLPLSALLVYLFIYLSAGLPIRHA